jgi:hypothetical protein
MSLLTYYPPAFRVAYVKSDIKVRERSRACAAGNMWGGVAATGIRGVMWRR